MIEGAILLAHGSRKEEANEEIRQMTEMVQETDRDRFYETAFLSLGYPQLADAVESLVKKGCEKIIIMPMFLVTGSHITGDIPDKILLQEAAYPNVKFVLTKHFGSHSGVIDIVRERIKEASAGGQL